MEEIIILTIILMILFIMLYLYIENNILKVSRKTIVDSSLPINFNNFKIVHLSDLHNNTSKVLTDALVSNIEKEKPNIIVITGDIVDSSRTNVKSALDFIDRIKNNNIYYVPGNHEARIKDYNILINGLANRNVTILDNKKVLISNICISGIKDPFFIERSTYKISGIRIIKKEIEELKLDKKSYNILLSHRPEAFNAYVENGINLVFTGHAHGGQWRVPFVGGLYAPHQGIFPKYTAGVHKKDNTNMVISRGLGNSSFPIRLNNRPELVVVEVTNEINN